MFAAGSAMIATVAGMQLKFHPLVRYAWVFAFAFTCLVGWRLTLL